jgi:acyl carrier protein
MSADTRDRVVKVVAQILKIEEAQIKDESRFVDDLGASSMQSVELIASFEEEFDIEMDEEKALDVKTIGDAVGFIAELL